MNIARHIKRARKAKEQGWTGGLIDQGFDERKLEQYRKAVRTSENTPDARTFFAGLRATMPYLFGGAGFFSFVVGSLLAVWTLYDKLAYGIKAHRNPLLLLVLLQTQLKTILVVVHP